MADEMHEIDELAALLALDALPPGEQADAELRHGTFPAGLSDVVAALAEGTAAQPPAGLREATLDRALARRPAGAPTGPAQPCTPTEAFVGTVEDFRGLLDSLSDDEWGVAAHEDHGTVRELVAHLVGVERLSVAWLDPAAPPPVDPSVDHVSSTRPVVDELATTRPAELMRQWHVAALAVVAMAGVGDRSRSVAFHDLSSDVDGLLVTRTFELWAHAMDIALATGRPMPTLDTARMALLSSRFMAALPFALAYRRQPIAGRSARFVLTGPSGGCYTVPLHPRDAAPAAGEPDVTIVTDALDLCRLAARRLLPAELDMTVEGDPALASAVLANVDAFARD